MCWSKFFYKKFLFVAGHRGTTTKSFFHIMMTFDDDRYEKLQNQLIQCDYEYNNSSRYEKPAAAVKVKIEIKPQYNRHSTTTEVFLCLNKEKFEFKTILWFPIFFKANRTCMQMQKWLILNKREFFILLAFHSNFISSVMKSHHGDKSVKKWICNNGKDSMIMIEKWLFYI